MDRTKNITSTIRIKVEELNKELILVIRENEQRENKSATAVTVTQKH